MRAPIAGGPPTPLTPVNAYSAWVAVDGKNIYWSDGQLGNPPGPTTILKMASGGGAPMALATGPEIINRFAVGRDGVYWTTSAGSVMKVGLSGGTPAVLATGQTTPTEIVVDATDVYWLR